MALPRCQNAENTSKKMSAIAWERLWKALTPAAAPIRPHGEEASHGGRF